MRRVLRFLVLAVSCASLPAHAQDAAWRWIWVSALATGEFETRQGAAKVSLPSASFRSVLVTAAGARVGTNARARKGTSLDGKVSVYNSGVTPFQVSGGITERTSKGFTPGRLQLIELSNGPYHRILVSRATD